MLPLLRLYPVAWLPPRSSESPYRPHTPTSFQSPIHSSASLSFFPSHLRTRSSGNATFSSAGRQRQAPTAVEAEVVEDAEGDVMEGGDGGEDEEGEDGESGEFFYSHGSRGRGGEGDYDRDPELAEIIGSCFEDPQKAQARVEERIRKKKNKILQTKTGSAKLMKVTFSRFDFSNSYIWLEFYNAPLTNDISLICDTIRSWHIIGRLGGCNSMNMQLSQLPLDHKRPTYDAIQGANVTPTTFYNIGDLEIQDNLARIWVDIGTTEPLLLDVLINALTNISSDYVGIKQVVFGGPGFENWKENFTLEDDGCSVHKI